MPAWMHASIFLSLSLSISLIDEIAKQFSKAENALYLGRGYQFPIALEGALKLKEISYIHAQGYPAGELKHGPIALISKNTPVIALVANDDCKKEIISNATEVKVSVA